MDLVSAAPALIRSIDKWTGMDRNTTSHLAGRVQGDRGVQCEDLQKEIGYSRRMRDISISKEPRLAMLEAKRRVHVVKTMVR